MNLLLASMVLLAQPTPKTTAGENEGYVASKLDALAVAKQADAGVANLKDAEASTILIIDLPGANGHAKGKIHRRDATHVFAQYGLMKGMDDVDTAFAVRNGNIVSLYGPPQKGRYPASNVKGLSGNARNPDFWLLKGALPIYASVVAGQPSFSQLVSSARQSSKFKVAVQERKLALADRTYQTVRVTITRANPALRVALTFDRRTFVPTTMIAEGSVKGGKGRMIWSATWKGPSKFPDSDFKLR